MLFIFCLVIPVYCLYVYKLYFGYECITEGLIWMYRKIQGFFFPLKGHGLLIYPFIGFVCISYFVCIPSGNIFSDIWCRPDLKNFWESCLNILLAYIVLLSGTKYRYLINRIAFSEYIISLLKSKHGHNYIFLISNIYPPANEIRKDNSFYHFAENCSDFFGFSIDDSFRNTLYTCSLFLRFRLLGNYNQYICEISKEKIIQFISRGLIYDKDGKQLSFEKFEDLQIFLTSHMRKLEDVRYLPGQRNGCRIDLPKFYFLK